MSSIFDLFRLDGHVAVITGGGRGIGRGIALAFADAGADVIVAARRKADVDEVAGQVQARGRRGIGVAVDIMEPGAIQGLVDLAMREFGKLTIWVNNAGGNRDRKMQELADVPEEEWDWMIDFNLKTAWQGAVAASRVMGPGSSILNIVSGAGLNAAPRTGVYGAAKAGLINMTMTLAHELAPKRIRSNAIAPGPIPTEQFLETFPLSEDQLAAIGGRMLTGRLGRPEDIATCALWLVSEAGSWVTGQTIAVNGGHVPGSMALRHEESRA
jgi:7-alpha-hydroxysteroid dehydrogenase